MRPSSQGEAAFTERARVVVVTAPCKRKSPAGAVQGAQPDDISALEPWARRWYSWVSAAFLKSYMELVGSAAFVPRSVEDMDVLLRAYLLEKALYEVTYELNNRPDWVRIPLHAIPQLLESAG